MHGLFAESQLHKYPLPLLSESLRVSEGALRVCLMPNDVLGHKGSNVGHSFTGVCMGQWLKFKRCNLEKLCLISLIRPKTLLAPELS